MVNTLMLLSGGHPVHRKFGETLEADTFQIKSLAAKGQPAPLKAFNLFHSALSIPGGYEYMLCESCYFYPALKRRLHLLGQSKIINLNCGPILHHILSGRVRGAEAKLLLDLLRDVDGHLAYGTFGEALLRRAGASDRPVRIVYPFIDADKLGRLLDIRPNLKSHDISLMATSDPVNKGIDILFQAVAGLRKEFPNATVSVITRMNPAEISSLDGYDPAFVRIMHDVKDVSQVLADSSLYAQPSRSDMFPVACLEAMAAGLPTLVSTENGAMEVVGKIDAGLVVRPDAKELKNAIASHFRLSDSARASLSGKFRDAAKAFEEKKVLSDFKKQFASLKQEL